MDGEQTARDNVKRLARIRGLTIKALAEAAGLSSSTLYNWLKESNPNNLGPAAFDAIAEVLEVRVEHLFYTEPHEKTGSTEEQARARALRQIDDLLAGIDDPEEQARAANIIIATLRAARDEFERRRAAPAGPRKPGVLPTPGPSSRHPRADG